VVRTSAVDSFEALRHEGPRGEVESGEVLRVTYVHMSRSVVGLEKKRESGGN